MTEPVRQRKVIGLCLFVAGRLVSLVGLGTCGWPRAGARVLVGWPF